MEFRLLGPVEVRDADQLVDTGPPRQLSVLTALAVDAGRPVSLDTLIDRVWGDSPPAQARHALYSYIAQIRRMLESVDGEPASLRRRSGGYLLGLPEDAIDVDRFRGLVDRARRPGLRDRDQADLLARALGLWRGTPLDGVTGPWADRVREGWHLQRIEAAGWWAEAQLRLGHPEAAIGPLSAIANEYPLVETLEGVLMRKLAQAGRGAEALDRYAALRKRLADELGVDPGSELQAIHGSILRGTSDQRPRVPDEQRRQEPARHGQPVGTVPAQLPAGVSAFTGRESALRELDEMLDGGGTGLPIVVVTGPGGVGKPNPGM